MIPVKRNKKVIAMAPMAGYTDFVFRGVVRKIYLEMATTEMISVKGIIYDDKTSWQMVIDTAHEPDTGIQLFGSSPEDFEAALTKIVRKVKPAFFELNAGCPVKKVVKKGAGAALLLDLSRLSEILRTIKEFSPVPVSLKTRLGWDSSSIVIEKVLEIAEEVDIDWVTIHARTKSQMYSGNARIEEFAYLPNKFTVPIIINGDIKDAYQVKKVFETWSFAGVAIGRAVLGNPWIFRMIRGGKSPTREEIVKVVTEHIDGSISYYGDKKGILKIIPHLVKYMKFVPEARKFRERIVRERDPVKMKEIFKIAFGVM